MSNRSKNLEALASLEDNWDGYGGKRPTSNAIGRADDFCFVPQSDGGVQVELNAGGMEIQITINPDGTVGGVYAGKP